MLFISLLAYGAIDIVSEVGLVIVHRPARLLIVALAIKLAFNISGLSAAEQWKWV